MKATRHDFGSFGYYRHFITHGATRIWQALFRAPGVLKRSQRHPMFLFCAPDRFIRFGAML